MRHTTIVPTIIISALAVAWACKTDEDTPPPPVDCETAQEVANSGQACKNYCINTQASHCVEACDLVDDIGLWPWNLWCGDDTETQGATWGTDGGGDDDDDDATTGEDFPCGEGTYLHECALVLEPVYLRDGSCSEPAGCDYYTYGELQTLLEDPNPRLCYSSEPSGGSSPAELVSGGFVCGVLEMPEEQACNDRCDALTLDEMGIPDTITAPGGPYDYDHHDCVPADEADSGHYTGTCADGADGDVTITGTPCPEEFCEEPEADSTGGDSDDGGQELDCTTYDTHGNLNVTRSGTTYFAVVDESWADHLLDYPGDVAKCDSGYYDWTATPHEWKKVTSGSFWYAAGVRSGDELVEAWEHDSSHAVVPGSLITISDYDDAVGIIGLLPSTGADLALSFKVLRGTRNYTFHLDPR